MMEFEELIKLIRTVSDSTLSEFKYEGDGAKVSMRADRGKKAAALATAGCGPQKEMTAGSGDQAAAEPAAGMVITSPLVGTFYAAPAEDAQDFVTLGETVRKGQTLAIIEAMKLMNEIESETDGTITGIFAGSGQTVEYGQPLFRIE